jgi:hypothetical protein
MEHQATGYERGGVSQVRSAGARAMSVVQVHPLPEVRHGLSGIL